MKQSVVEIRKWVQIISDDYMHYTPEQYEHACAMASVFDFEVMPNEGGVIGWIVAQDFDCKKKMSVLLLYCKPEYRGRSFIPMLRRLEEIAKQEGVDEIIIGSSISGYKGDKFNKVLSRFGYHLSGYKKEM